MTFGGEGKIKFFSLDSFFHTDTIALWGTDLLEVQRFGEDDYVLGYASGIIQTIRLDLKEKRQRLSTLYHYHQSKILSIAVIHVPERRFIAASADASISFWRYAAPMPDKIYHFSAPLEKVSEDGMLS